MFAIDKASIVWNAVQCLICVAVGLALYAAAVWFLETYGHGQIAWGDWLILLGVWAILAWIVSLPFRAVRRRFDPAYRKFLDA